MDVCISAYFRSFHFEDLRIDEALRQYLEAFRLPGEAPVISLVMEHFADHWHVSPVFHYVPYLTLSIPSCSVVSDMQSWLP